MTTMLDTAQVSKLEALLRLLDDDSTTVREAVSRELQAYGVDIALHIHEQNLLLSPVEWDTLRTIVFEVYQHELRNRWSAWRKEENDVIRLERALAMLARFQNGPQYRPDLSELLDRLSEEYIAETKDAGYATLARFLFTDKQIRCMEESDEDANAGNLSSVIEEKMGLPISLVCLYILMGHRHGLQISGCNWPGNFYARFREDDQLYVVDCGAGGLVLEADELLRLQGPSREAAEAVLTLDLDAATLIKRTLSNLAFAYRREGNTDCSLLMLDLLRDMERASRRGYHNTTTQ